MDRARYLAMAMIRKSKESKVEDIFKDLLAMGYISDFEKNPVERGNLHISEDAPAHPFQLYRRMTPIMWKLTPADRFLELPLEMAVSPDGYVYLMVISNSVNAVSTRLYPFIYYYRDNIYLHVIKKHKLIEKLWSPGDWSGETGEYFREKNKRRKKKSYIEHLKEWKEKHRRD